MIHNEVPNEYKLWVYRISVQKRAKCIETRLKNATPAYDVHHQKFPVSYNIRRATVAYHLLDST